MAQEAHDRAKRQMDLATEMRLAELVVRGAKQLQERVAEEGVTAFLRKPVFRAPPNERFLRNTLRSVEFANQQNDIDEMWRMRQQQIDREKGNQKSWNGKRFHESDHDEDTKRRRVSPRRDHPGKINSNVFASFKDSALKGLTAASVDKSKEVGTDDDGLHRLLSSRVVRGRGGVGPRQDGADGLLLEPEVTESVDTLCIFKGGKGKSENEAGLKMKKKKKVKKSKKHRKEEAKKKSKKKSKLEKEQFHS